MDIEKKNSSPTELLRHYLRSEFQLNEAVTVAMGQIKIGNCPTRVTLMFQEDNAWKAAKIRFSEILSAKGLESKMSTSSSVRLTDDTNACLDVTSKIHLHDSAVKFLMDLAIAKHEKSDLTPPLTDFFATSSGRPPDKDEKGSSKICTLL